MLANNIILEGDKITLLETEIWKPIKGYEGLYEVSNMGRVKRLPTSFECGSRWGKDRIITFKGRILSVSKADKKHYPIVWLSLKNKVKNYSVHRLVATAFLSNSENKLQVNHIDGNRDNNNVSNLEWVTGNENMMHSYYILKNQKVGQKTIIDVETGIVYDSIMDAFNSKKYGYKYSTIARQLSGSLKNLTPLQYV
jgi:hypothetical protein